MRFFHRFVVLAYALFACGLISGNLFADEATLTDESSVDRTTSEYTVLAAFRSSYPEKVDDLAVGAYGWALNINGTLVYWAEGRFLLSHMVENAEGFTRHPFYPYSPSLPVLVDPGPERKQALEARIAKREENPPTRFPGIYNLIWRISDEATAWNQVKTAFFFGKKLLIHRDLLDELASIEEELRHVMGTDAALRDYIRSLDYVEGFSWRPIAGTASLSYHSYGIAIDFLPKSTGGKETYWRWARDRHREWYILPYDQRYSPPDVFIEAFERRGFIWGGKWFYFDTMHFEYRPEILALNGYTRSSRENPVTGVIETVWDPPNRQ